MMPKRSVKLKNDLEKLGNSPENDFWKYLRVNWHLTFSGKKDQKGKDFSFCRIQRNFIFYNKIIKKSRGQFHFTNREWSGFLVTTFLPWNIFKIHSLRSFCIFSELIFTFFDNCSIFLSFSFISWKIISVECIIFWIKFPKHLCNVKTFLLRLKHGHTFTNIIEY